MCSPLTGVKEKMSHSCPAALCGVLVRGRAKGGTASPTPTPTPHPRSSIHCIAWCFCFSLPQWTVSKHEASHNPESLEGSLWLLSAFSSSVASASGTPTPSLTTALLYSGTKPAEWLGRQWSHSRRKPTVLMRMS